MKMIIYCHIVGVVALYSTLPGVAYSRGSVKWCQWTGVAKDGGNISYM